LAYFSPPELEHIKDARVGDPERRGISGGQKKRVNIGMELVAYPRVLFLDEPTSGLDSSTSLQVARCLAKLKALGITIVCVIHQPRYSVFNCFSDLLLMLPGGKTAYRGRTADMQAYFGNLGFLMAPGENAADWMMDKESRNTPFCPSQERFHTVVLRGVRNISESP
jgi:ABC-type multidrug transport system ATPase subunit